MHLLSYFGVLVFAVIAVLCVVAMAMEWWQSPKGTLWPDGEDDALDDIDEPPVLCDPTLPILMQTPPSYPIRMSNKEITERARLTLVSMGRSR